MESSTEPQHQPYLSVSGATAKPSVQERYKSETKARSNGKIEVVVVMEREIPAGVWGVVEAKGVAKRLSLSHPFTITTRKRKACWEVVEG